MYSVRAIQQQHNAYCSVALPAACLAESGPLFQPTPHAFKPWRRDFIVDWRHSRARDQVRAVAAAAAAAASQPGNALACVRLARGCS
jgi:hypothetical protein